MKKILIIEDSLALREEISLILKFEGYDVVEAENGLEGLEKSKKFKPDLIISDIFMKKMNGFEILNEVRHNMLTMEIPFVFLTSEAGNNTRLLAKQLGADDYVIKPFDTNKLIEAVKNQLNMRTSSIVLID